MNLVGDWNEGRKSRWKMNVFVLVIKLFLLRDRLVIFWLVENICCVLKIL